MCGITGIAGLHPAHPGTEMVRDMTRALQHRGPNDEGFFEAQRVFLGHKRLSIIDLSDSGRQPMEDASGRFVLVYNGEIFNYESIRPSLGDYPFQSRTDSEVLLAAWAKWGPDCLEKLNGHFAFAIYDKTAGSLFLVRDRLGIKPLYYAEVEGQLVFASEIRALLRSGLVRARLDLSAVADFLSYQTVHAPRTMVEGVWMVPAGGLLEYSGGRLNQRIWWEMSQFAKTGLSANGKDDGSRHLKPVRELLTAAVERRMISDVPLGAFLSGGIDSSAVVALMAETASGPVSTFSVVFEEKQYDESKWSDLIAKQYKTDHHPILLRPERFLEELPAALEAMDHPSGDGINSYVVSKVTREAGVTVALSGLGGDELFAGYPVFTQLPAIRAKKWLWAMPYPLRRMLAGTVAGLMGGSRSEKLKALLRIRSAGIEGIYPIYRRLYDEAGLGGLLKGPVPDYNAVVNWLSAHQKGLAKLPFLSRISVAEIRNYTENVLLRDTDQMSMAHSLEVRVPFFDHELVEYVLGIPDSAKHPHFPKQLLVRALGNRLPEELVHREKMGFVFPWDRWLRKELKGFAQERLDRLGEYDAFDGDGIRRAWEGFLGEKGGRMWLHIWMLVVLSDWMERNDIG